MPSGLFSLGFPTKRLCPFLISPICDTSPIHHILLDLVPQIIYGEEYIAWGSSPCMFYVIMPWHRIIDHWLFYGLYRVHCAGLSDFSVCAAVWRHFSRQVAQLFRKKFRQTSQYVVPCGGIFLGKWRSSFARSSDGKMNVQSACALNTRYKDMFQSLMVHSVDCEENIIVTVSSSGFERSRS
jgi:hypothetical protein